MGQLERFALGQLHTKVVLQSIRNDGKYGLKWAEAIPFHQGAQHAVHWYVVQPLLRCKENIASIMPSDHIDVLDEVHELLDPPVERETMFSNARAAATAMRHVVRFYNAKLTLVINDFSAHHGYVLDSAMLDMRESGRWDKQIHDMLDMARRERLVYGRKR